MIRTILVNVSIMLFIVYNAGSSETQNVRKKQLDISLQNDISQSIRKGLIFLKNAQEGNGSWQQYPAITALCLSSFLRSGFGFSTQDTFIRMGFDFLLNTRQPDGGIYTDQNANYNSAISLMAFRDATNADYENVIRGLEHFLLGLQYDEGKGYTNDSLFYGGTGYGFKERPDLSNVQWSMEALYIQSKEEIEITRDEIEKSLLKRKTAYFEKALQFLKRCQNLSYANPEPYSGNDGGFMYGPGISKAGGQKSYGSMTYAGLKSMIHASLTRDDPRVIAAFQWLSNNYTLEENPGMGAQGLFYYYHTMAKALRIYGNETITDSQGKKHNWREELANTLVSLQKTNGSWINEKHARWFEDNPVLVTSYCILALEQLLRE